MVKVYEGTQLTKNYLTSRPKTASLMYYFRLILHDFEKNEAIWWYAWRNKSKIISFIISPTFKWKESWLNISTYYFINIKFVFGRDKKPWSIWVQVFILESKVLGEIKRGLFGARVARVTAR